ncbi:zinc ribbon domain-containing protein [Methanobacterium paludis]|nr:zinc ribbon domain-containing protein [Methanobacterium paludis]
MLEAKRRGIDLKRENLNSENFKICPSCKAKNHERALFCVKCGHKLDKITKNNKICPSCNAENLAKAKFCTNCGNKLQSMEEEFDKISDVSSKETQTLHKEPKIDKKEFKDIEEPEIIKTSVPNKELVNKKICPACKSKNLKNAKFCVVCGKNFEGNDLKDEDLNKERTELAFIETKNEPSLLDKVGKYSQEEKIFDLKIQTEINVPEDINKINDGSKLETETKPLISKDLKENGKVEGFGDMESEDVKSEDIKSEDIKSGNVKSEDTKSESETPKKEGNVDPIEKIKKAKELLDIGAITSEEFNAIKNKYLEKI